MKRLKLIDINGREIDLNDTASQFMYNVKGLGFSFSNTFSNVADGFFPESYKRIEQGAVAGTIAFMSNDAYRAFIDFVSKADGLRIGYAPSGAWFYAYCSVTRLLKEDKAALTCDIELRLLSPWAKQSPIKKTIEAGGAMLQYPHRYPYQYGKATADASAEFQLGGNMDGAYDIIISGAVSNPSIKLFAFKDGWQEIGQCNIRAVLGANDTLVLSTVPGSERVDLNGTDISALLDITDNVFERPKIGKNKIVIESDKSITATASINIYDYFVSV